MRFGAMWYQVLWSTGTNIATNKLQNISFMLLVYASTYTSRTKDEDISFGWPKASTLMTQEVQTMYNPVGMSKPNSISVGNGSNQAQYAKGVHKSIYETLPKKRPHKNLVLFLSCFFFLLDPSPIIAYLCQ